jgi:hypothetical protein
MATKTNVAQLEERIEKLEELVQSLQGALENMPKPRDRGPDSTREMTEDDAERVCYGDLKELSHKKAAEELGLSYGQIYSARGQYTFKQVHRKHA